MSSTQESNHSEHSPQHHDGPLSSKRRRIALACLDCRRRKLKCDRTYPACTRCQKRGHAASCTYDPDAIEVVSTGELQRTNDTRDAIAVTNGSKALATPISFVHHHQLDTDDSTIGRLQLHIHQLENRVIGLERVTNGGRQCLGDIPSRATSGRGVDGSTESEPEDKELMMFRGKNFKTSFYGTSHHTSYLSHVRTVPSTHSPLV